MTDEIISVTKLENTSTDYELYELLTDRLNHINDHITLRQFVYDGGYFFLSDDGYTLNELEMHGIKITGKSADRIDELLADHNVRRGIWQDNFRTGLCREDEFGDEVTNFLDTIEAIYKEFLGQEKKMTFKDLLDELLETYEKKNSDYGDSFKKTHLQFGEIAGLTRISDKVNRLVSLSKKTDSGAYFESKRDTYMDLANYCLMQVLVMDSTEEDCEEPGYLRNKGPWESKDMLLNCQSKNVEGHDETTN